MPEDKRKMPQRIVIYPQDVQSLTGRSSRYARQLLQDIRIALKKEKGALVSIKEFSSYTKIAETEIREQLEG